MYAKKISYLTLVLALIVGLFAAAMPTGTVTAAPIVVYDAVPATLPPNLPSLGFQATQTAEFGDYIHLGGTNRELRTVTVTMSTWALQSTYPAMIDPAGWTHPITLNIYNAILGTPNTLGSLLATKTQSFLIPWRPEADPTCATPTAWRAADLNCYNGFAFNITFDMASLNLTLPNDIIVGIAYNTNTWGYNPIGLPGPYESLNVGLEGVGPSIGTDVNPDNVFWNTATAGWYTDGGAAGVGIFREDTGWTPYILPIQITADALPTTLYVNQGWSGISEGMDPDGAGPATMMGYDAFATIQAAINAAVGGELILVSPGTYNEKLSLNKPNLTVRSTLGWQGAETTILDVPDGTLTTGVDVLANMGVVTFQGFTVRDFTESGIIQRMSQAAGTTFHVLNNVIRPAGTYLRNAIQVTGNGSTVIGNTVYGERLTVDWGSCGVCAVNASNVLIVGNTILGGPNGMDNGIGLLNYYSANPMDNVIIQNNTVHNADTPLDIEAYAGAITNVRAESNRFTEYLEGVAVITDEGGTVSPVDASPNWWGSVLGPQGEVPADAAIAPWCGDEWCGTFLPDGNNRITLSGPISQSGGMEINVPGLTIVLANGTVIQNSSPCFIVNASYTTITAESIGGAKCVPTNGSNGIDVAANLVNIIIQGIEFDGTAQNTGAGVAFAGNVTDVQVVDNYFHDLDGPGIVFGGTVTNNQGVQGNLFQRVADPAISSTVALNAEFNSWGNMAGVNLPNVDSDPFTHVDLYMASSGTPWVNQVFSGGSITYTISANLQQVMGADFRLTYDSNLLSVASASAGIYFPIPVRAGGPLDTSVPGVISFAGYANTPVSGSNLALFSVTFNAVAPGTVALNLDEATDAFAMFPGYGPSTNIYAAALLDGSVTVIDQPVLSSTDLVGPYLTGLQQEFHVRLQDPAAGGTFNNVLVNFRITGAVPADISILEVLISPGVWAQMMLTQQGADLVGFFGPPFGFQLAPGYDSNVTYRITYNTAKAYPFVITVNDLNSIPANAVLATLSQTANVYARPTLASTLDGNYLVGVPEPFTLTITNPDLAHTYADSEIQFSLPVGAQLEYWNGSAWVIITSPFDLGALAPGATVLPLRISFSGPVTGNVVFTLVQTSPTIWPLNSLTVPVTAYANFTLTGTVSMQGRTVRNGVLMTLTGPTLFPYGPYTATSINQISNNLSFSQVAAGTYLVTTLQARYLDVTAALNITKIVDASHTSLALLELKGGDANDNNEIELGDASIIAGQYGTLGIENAGDVNFSGKVDIFDLVLVGGNYTLNSLAAYGTWAP